MATAVSLTLAAASVSSGDSDVDNGVAHTRGSTGAQVAGGVNGFKLVGMALGLAVPRAGSATLWAYGAGMSVYSHFIARGREVVFPKNTPMEIGTGRPQEGTAGAAPGTSAAAGAARN